MKKLRFSDTPYEGRVPEYAGKISYDFRDFGDHEYNVGLESYVGSYTSFDDAERMLLAAMEMRNDYEVPCFYFDADGGVEQLEIVEE